MSHLHLRKEHQPVANRAHQISRRRFIASAGVLTAATWLSPRQLFADNENIVATARKRAETATITVKPLRGNVSALIGSGGNIAVLSGPDGKVIIDSGYSTSRGKITDAIAQDWSGADQTSREHALAFRSHRRQRMDACGRRHDPRP